MTITPQSLLTRARELCAYYQGERTGEMDHVEADEAARVVVPDLADALLVSMALVESLHAHRTELTRERDTANRQMERADEESVRFRNFYEDHQHEETGASRVNELTRERDEARGEVKRLRPYEAAATKRAHRIGKGTRR